MNATLKSKKSLFAALLACLAVAAAAVLPANAEVVEVGDTGAFPTPACPDANTCQAVAQLTGYQIQSGTRKNPFRVTRSGRLVAFTLELPQTTDKQTKFFNDKFGGGPSARMSILRPRARKGVKYRYVLAAQTPVYQLTDYLGSTPQFSLRETLTVRPNDVIAITTETWLPAFSVSVDDTNVWRASRAAKNCDDVSKPAMHDKVGEIKVYGCGYKTARLLYKATVVTDPKKTTKKKSSKR